MRIRSIKPQFFLDSKILDLPPLARLLFIGLWCCADREGRMHYDPRELRRQVLPDETQAVFDEMFGALTAANLVRLYAVESSSYVDIPHFLAHQVPYHKEQPSVIPSRDGSRPGKGRVKTRTRKGHDRSGAGVVIGAGEEGSTTLAPSFAEAANSTPTVLTFPTNGEPRMWHLTPEQVRIWTDLFPGIEVEAECRKALAWILANRKKTAKGMPRFLNGWLSKSNDRGSVRAFAPKLSIYEQNMKATEGWDTK
jgi:hypothetical protein